MRADSPAFPQLATTLRGQRFTENDHVIINDVQKQLTNNRKQNGKTESERHTRTEHTAGQARRALNNTTQ